MNPISLQELARKTGGVLQNGDPEVLVTDFATDSREVDPGDLFLAIRGAQADGHAFAQKALDGGAVATLAEREVPGPHILVDDLVQALARLALSYRTGFTGPVVGVTGSAGKSTTKEFIAAALRPLGPVLKNEGNRNTEFTSPLVWTGLQPRHRAAVIEMGMRGFGQIAHLASFSKPTIGVVTNVGFAHIELVGNREGVAQAKSELLEALPGDGWAVIWREDPYADYLVQKSPKGRVRTFGFSECGPEMCQIRSYETLSWTASRVDGVCGGEEWEAILPVAGRHIALNAAAAVMVASLAGVPASAAADALAGARIPPMRMQVLELNGATVLLDCYNASPPSMTAAIETLADLKVAGRRRAVIGEMRELGEASESSHLDLGDELAGAGLDEILFVGPQARMSMDRAVEAGADTITMSHTESLREVTEFLSRTTEGDAVLIKGSRALELERALEPLGARAVH